MKIIDTKEYVSVLKEQVEAGQEAVMKIAGNSMAPFLIHDRDFICFSTPEKALKKGDMVFYQRENGQFIMHRICKVSSDGYYMTGDAQEIIEGPVKREQIFARITKVQRKGKWITEGDFWWIFFEKIWINMIPWRRTMIRLYGIIRKFR